MSDPEIPYDEHTARDLVASLEDLRQGEATCWYCRSRAAYNACQRFVVLHDLRYDWDPDVLVFKIYPPD